MLYELGGMTVVHDASGCNSTYATHDEPRWYDMDSMIFVSGLTEIDAVLGNDEKFIDDVVTAANELTPKFIMICGSPMPMMTGTDFDALAMEIETRSGIPAFGLHTDGMHSYLPGASEALVALLQRFCRRDISKKKENRKPSINIIGATPLDFSTNGSVEAMRSWLMEHGFHIVSCMAMGSTLNEVMEAGSADVNLVISSSGLAAAKWLNEQFGTPFVTGIPFGIPFADDLFNELEKAIKTGVSSYYCVKINEEIQYSLLEQKEQDCLAVIGESVFASSLARAIEMECRIPVHILCPLESAPELLRDQDEIVRNEDEIEQKLVKFAGIVADPMYEPICPDNVKFYALPHEAFSGRCYRKEIPNLIHKPVKIVLEQKKKNETFGRS